MTARLEVDHSSQATAPPSAAKADGIALELVFNSPLEDNPTIRRFTLVAARSVFPVVCPTKRTIAFSRSRLIAPPFGAAILNSLEFSP